MYSRWYYWPLNISVYDFRVTSLFSSKKDEAAEPPALVKKQAEINIFTVASGLLYEVRLEIPFFNQYVIW